MLELKNNMPRWIIFLIDVAICAVSLIIAYLLRFNFSIPPEADKHDLPYVITIVLATRILSFFIGKTYAGIIRYTSTEDAKRIFITISVGSAFFILCNSVG